MKLKKPKKPDSLHLERTRKEHWLARKHELECAELEGRLVDIDKFVKRWGPSFLRQKAIVMASKLTDQEKYDLLTEMERVARD